MRAQIFIFVLICLACSGRSLAADIVQFQQLIESPVKYSGTKVRIKCVISLFGERTILTAAGMSPKFDADAIYVLDDRDWRSSKDVVAMREKAWPILQKFKKEHPELTWPEVEAEVEMVGVFRMPNHGIGRFSFLPAKLISFHLMQVIAMENGESHAYLRIFPIQNAESRPENTTGH